MSRSADERVQVHEFRLELGEFAHACGITTVLVEELVREGVLAPRQQAPGFSGDELVRVRRAMRLQRDFEAPLPRVAVWLDMLDEIERLRARLRAAGLGED
jgi:chaperone modulatory protein CbpM